MGKRLSCLAHSKGNRIHHEEAGCPSGQWKRKLTVKVSQLVRIKICAYVAWKGCLALMCVLADQTRADVLSSPLTALCASLYGRSIFPFDGSCRQALLESGNPASPAGMLQSLEIDLWNGHFFGTTTRVMSDMRSYGSGHQAAGEHLLKP